MDYAANVLMLFRPFTKMKNDAFWSNVVSLKLIEEFSKWVPFNRELWRRSDSLSLLLSISILLK